MGKLIGVEITDNLFCCSISFKLEGFLKKPHFFTVVVLHEKTKIKITRTEFCLDKDTQNNTAL